METEPTVADLTGALPNMTADYFALVPGTNKRTGWVITFAGPSHPRTIQASNEATRKDLLKSSRMESARVNGRKYKAEDQQPEESKREFIESIVSRIVSWTPVKIGNQTFTFSDKDAVDLLVRPEMGNYVSQFVDFLTNEAAFMPGSANG